MSTLLRIVLHTPATTQAQQYGNQSGQASWLLRLPGDRAVAADDPRVPGARSRSTRHRWLGARQRDGVARGAGQVRDLGALGDGRTRSRRPRSRSPAASAASRMLLGSCLPSPLPSTPHTAGRTGRPDLGRRAPHREPGYATTTRIAFGTPERRAQIAVVGQTWPVLVNPDVRDQIALDTSRIPPAPV